MSEQPPPEPPTLDYARPQGRDVGERVFESVLLGVMGFFGGIGIVGVSGMLGSFLGVWITLGLGGLMLIFRGMRGFGLGLILAVGIPLLILWTICGRP